MHQEHHLREELGVKVVGMDKLRPLKTFDDLPFYGRVKKSMDREGWHRPTTIQSYAIPIILSNRHIIGVSSTGSGKTLAYVLPLVYLTEKVKNSRVLALAPTRELARQIAGEFEKLMGRDVGCLYGGVPLRSQSRDLAKRVVVATPGRFMHFLDWGKMNTQFDFVVIDEADRLLEGTFLEDLDYIFKNIGDFEQISLFTATITKDVEAVARKFMKDQVRLTIGGSISYNKNIKQQIIEISRNPERIQEIVHLLRNCRDQKCLIFANTKAWVEDLYYTLQKQTRASIGYIHGDVPQDRRERIMTDFRKDRIQVLIATDVASRGLDISDIKLIINFQFPKDLKTYTHRIGRTARHHKKGKAITFIGREQPYLMYELVDFMVKCSQKIPEYLISLSGYPPKRVQELEQSLAQIQVPLQSSSSEESVRYVEKKEPSKRSENSFKVKEKERQKSVYSSDSNSDNEEEKDKFQVDASNLSFKKTKKQQEDDILNQSYVNLSFRKQEQSILLESSKIITDKKSIMEQHSLFKKQQFDVRKYKPTDICVSTSMKNKELSIVYGDYKDQESEILVLGKGTPTYERVLKEIKECRDKSKASSSMEAIEEAEKIIKEKAIKTIQVPILQNYKACLFVNSPKLKRQFIWAALFQELENKQTTNPVISMPIEVAPSQKDQIAEDLKDISSQLNNSKEVDKITLIFTDAQICKQWIGVMVEKKMI